jgi:hypothetical protein
LEHFSMARFGEEKRQAHELLNQLVNGHSRITRYCATVRGGKRESEMRCARAFYYRAAGGLRLHGFGFALGGAGCAFS